MRYILKLHFFILICFFLGCRKTTNSKESKALEEQEVYTEPEFVIDGIYGTSTAIPLFDNHAINVLDGNTNTSWKTIKGAGPKEGIMVYFNKPIYIKKINITQPKGQAITQVTQFDVYANGKIHTTENINSTVEALFIGIKEVNAADVNTNTFKTGIYNNAKGSNTTFSPTLSVAISKIDFFNNSGNKIDFVIPKLVKASIKASSTLTPEVAYSVANLFDCKKDFGWAENASSNGIGESILINTDAPITYNKIKVWNGYQRSPKHFDANGSVKKLHLTNNVQLDEVLDLKNIKDPQAYYIKNRKSTTTLKLTLDNIYQGQKYEDVLMSEIRLYEKNIPIILLSSDAEQVVKNNQGEKVSSSIMAYILDKNIQVDYTKREAVEDTFLNQSKETSFILRSNNSFVMYTSESQGYEKDKAYNESQTIADGNWELISKNEEAIKVRIFGRIYDVFNGVDPYKGKGRKESIKIFKDIVTITKDAIEGEKFIDQIQLR